MNAALSNLRGRLDEVRSRIDLAARRSGRDSRGIVLVAVVKSVPADVVRAAVEVGLVDLGENRVQEAERKVEAVGRERARWHMIGHLQRNKARVAATLFDRIHSVDSLELARVLSRRAAEVGRPVPVLIQVNASGEATKHGVTPGDVRTLVDQVMELPGIGVDGLMCVGPLVDDPEKVRPCFARTRELCDAVERDLGVKLPELSMGMSGDYEVAIEEGSTMVRVGTALFGPRN